MVGAEGDTVGAQDDMMGWAQGDTVGAQGDTVGMMGSGDMVGRATCWALKVTWGSQADMGVLRATCGRLK